MKKRNLEYEKKFRKYLFSFDFQIHKEICKNINVRDNQKGKAKLFLSIADLNGIVRDFNKLKSDPNKEDVSLKIGYEHIEVTISE